MDYKVTLAMPVYNVEKYVERALLSALNQTFDSIEFLIVDDKGNDRSMDIVRKVVSTHPRGKDVRIIDHVVNQGTGATKNSAIREAKGEYLFFMDSDDEISFDCIEFLYNKAISLSVELVISSYASVIINEKMETIVYDDIVRYDTLRKYFYIEKNDFPVFTWNKLYSINFLRLHAIYCIPNHLCEDVYFSFLVTNFCSSFAFVDKITYYYYQNVESLTWKGYTPQLIVMNQEALEKKKEYILQMEVGQMQNAMMLRLVSECLYFIEKVIGSNLSVEKKKHIIVQILNRDIIHSIQLQELFSRKEKMYLLAFKTLNCAGLFFFVKLYSIVISLRKLLVRLVPRFEITS